ncbi:MAG: carbamoyltransferase, partial [Deltaproteobacteria bacterium]
AAILKDDEILAAAQEERFTRKKHDPSFPSNAIRYCLINEGIAVDELDAVVFYDKPLLKFERLLETYYAFAPNGFQSFSSAIPVWVKEKLMLKKLIMDELSSIGEFDRNKIKLLFPEHHLSHAGSAFFPSPFDESAILTIDGVGEWATASICHGTGNRIKILKELKFPHSVGLLYTAFTYYLGFKVNSGEYKLMGLAPYGDPESERVGHYIETIKKELVDISDDGSIWLNQDYFDYATGLRMVNEDKWSDLFGFPVRKPEGELLAEHCDLALAIQKITEEAVIKMSAEAKRLTGSRNICLAGGVALNCVANGRLLREGLFDDMWIQPAAGDAGGALGAAYCAYYIYYDKPRTADGKTDKMRGSYLGPQFSDLDIQLTEKRYKGVSTYFDNTDELCLMVGELLDEGKVIGWVQGKMEWGPRALGNRSIISDARKPDIQKKLNLKIKFREGFRPFAPSVLIEDVDEYFDFKKSSPYMLLIADVKPERRKTLPDGYHSLPWRDKLYYLRSDLPAITHIDYSARLQTVHRDTNPLYWQLIERFKERTGYGVIVNTSFNVRGEPIVCSPEDAYRCFMRTEMDFLVLGNFIFDKMKQQEWPEKVDAKDLHGID